MAKKMFKTKFYGGLLIPPYLVPPWTGSKGSILVKKKKGWFEFVGRNGKTIMRSARYGRMADCNRIARRTACRLGLEVRYESQ
jgi:hypothetical protein